MPLIYTPIDDFGPGGAGVNGAWQIAQGSSEIGELIIPDSYLGKPVRRIAELAFFGSTTITKLIIPSSITRIYSGAFHNCANLTEIIIAPDGGMLIIDPRAFKNCSALKKIFFPDRVSFSSFSIGDGEHFAGCTSLVSVRLMTTPSLGLPPALFNGCISLKSIVIPAGVDYLGDSTFRNCTNLSAIYFLGNCPLISASSLVNTHPNLKLYRKKKFVTGWESTLGGKPVVLWSDNIIKSGGAGKLTTKKRTFGLPNEIYLTINGCPSLEGAFEGDFANYSFYRGQDDTFGLGSKLWFNDGNDICIIYDGDEAYFNMGNHWLIIDPYEQNLYFKRPSLDSNNIPTDGWGIGPETLCQGGQVIITK